MHNTDDDDAVLSFFFFLWFKITIYIVEPQYHKTKFDVINKRNENKKEEEINYMINLTKQKEEEEVKPTEEIGNEK